MNTNRLIALDLFAGTGWGVACQRLGIEEYGVELMPEAVATRDAAGMETIFRDVWDGLQEPQPRLLTEAEREERRRVLAKMDAGEVLLSYELLIASPPCQTFSVAGKGAGRAALDDVLGAIRFGAYKNPETLRAVTEGLDDRTALVLTPLTYAYRDRPTYIVFEQVPTVLPVWQACAEVLRGIGYSVVTGVLNAEQYGVPQTRKRAILFARKDGVEATMPTPTHSRYYSRSPEKLDEGVQKWVSMAEALGWGMTERPYPTVATGTEQGGTDPAALGGSGARKLVYGERARGAWEPSGNADNDGGILRLTDQDAAVLQSYPRGSEWAFRRPSTTIVASDIVAGPGRSDFVKGGVSRQNRPGSTKVQDNEAAVLQSYPDGFRWDVDYVDPRDGKTKPVSRGKRFLQIGNAVPPLLGQAILAPIAAALALNMEQEIAA